MPPNYRTHAGTRQAITPQSEPIPGRESEMVANNAGGVVFAADDWTALDRFLILGTEGGTYYVGEKKLTKDAAQAVQRCIAADGVRVVDRLVEISHAGRAPKNDPALFVLAMCAGLGDDKTRRAALASLPQVARIGTHLFHFAEFVEGFRGWGRGLRRAIGAWYDRLDFTQLALQAVKYPQRDGWSHRDMLRLAHRPPGHDVRDMLINWIVNPDDVDLLPAVTAASGLIDAVYGLRVPGIAPPIAARLIREGRVPREAVPTELLNNTEVWSALLEDMPMTAMIRNLAKMTAVGLLGPLSADIGRVVSKLSNQEELVRARVHPISILLALKTYAQGHGEKGKLAWTPVPQIVDALDQAFYAAFGNVVPTGKRTLVAVDVSGSMAGACVGSGVLSCREAGAAVAMTFLKTEPNAYVIAFDTVPHEPALSGRQRLDDVMRSLNRWNGGTDVAQPVLYALQRKLEVDAFVIATDNETWAGHVHPAQALEQYRKAINPNAKLVCLSAAANGASIVDPKDALSFGCAGFDANVPDLAADFIRG